MTYVYILQSIEHPDRFYAGITSDLRERLKKHNAKGVPHTAKYAPWRIKTYVGFSDEKQAFAFEKYLKSASGQAFAKKRLRSFACNAESDRRLLWGERRASAVAREPAARAEHQRSPEKEDAGGS